MGNGQDMGRKATFGNFTFVESDIKDVIIVESKVFGDERGGFMEAYKRPDFVQGGITADFVQDNQSVSRKGVLRGLHFQINHPQAKLVRVIDGCVYDVCVDLRKGSPTFGKWEGVELSDENHRQLFIPRGFAHGFYVMSDRAVFCYKCDDVYHSNDEGGITWDDRDLAVAWPLEVGAEPVLSQKDQAHPTFAEWKKSNNI
jgi:dTDP-4-dehydrorhamnose 3,5-epimerase